MRKLAPTRKQNPAWDWAQALACLLTGVIAALACGLIPDAPRPMPAKGESWEAFRERTDWRAN